MPNFTLKFFSNCQHTIDLSYSFEKYDPAMNLLTSKIPSSYKCNNSGVREEILFFLRRKLESYRGKDGLALGGLTRMVAQGLCGLGWGEPRPRGCQCQHELGLGELGQRQRQGWLG